MIEILLFPGYLACQLTAAVQKSFFLELPRVELLLEKLLRLSYICKSFRVLLYYVHFLFSVLDFYNKITTKLAAKFCVGAFSFSIYAFSFMYGQILQLELLSASSAAITAKHNKLIYYAC